MNGKDFAPNNRGMEKSGSELGCPGTKASFFRLLDPMAQIDRT
jgi:hypothetical protein